MFTTHQVDGWIPNKFQVRRTDGNRIHNDCRYLVLDLTHDPVAQAMLPAIALQYRRAGKEHFADDLLNLTESE
jgi:hypothetical protein